MNTSTGEMIQEQNAEKRYLPRWTANLPALCKTPCDGEARTGVIKNLNCKGACFYGEVSVQCDEMIELTITLSSVTVKVNAMVHWVKIEDNQKLVGVSFSNISAAAQEAVLHHMLKINHIDLADYWFRGCY